METYSHERSLNKRMRSFLFSGEEMRTQWRDFNTNNLRLKLLRVLDIQGIVILAEEGICLGLPDVIGELVHLRYLGIANTRLKSLPSFIPNLRFLQTLDASGNDLLKGTTDLSNFTSLRHLLGLFVGELDLSSFSKLTNLRALSLKVPTFKLSSDEAVGFRTLVEFTLRCGVRRIPRDMDLMFPSLESLTLVAMKFEEDPMPALQELQRLEDLALQNCDCLGEKMSISANGFGRLRKLEIIKIILDELQIEEEAMPNLVKLNLTNRVRPTKLIIPNRLRAFARLPTDEA
ncbi:hypothetical protein Bca52824_000988 [Brassica carinata]|uniref:Disease resistance R13L4/SHOC-2-like LRR domain-containing protein n=1 Tax=Brassica carinata TaxID=52824 RepID=A0A8X7WF74_BRACI|nr:hypothetical protein Bca52824_000988 [Brassica carinata]